MQTLKRIRAIALAIALSIAVVTLSSVQAYARGGLGGFHGEGYHIGGVGVPYGGESLGPAAAGHTGVGYGKVHFHPSIGYYHPSSQPFSYSLGGVGGFHYNQSYANPYVYHNPYIYNPFSSPYHVPFAHAF